MSALLHLVEAATALNHLPVGPTSPSTSRPAPPPSSSASVSASAAIASPPPAPAYRNDLAVLRENHLRASASACASPSFSASRSTTRSGFLDQPSAHAISDDDRDAPGAVAAAAHGKMAALRENHIQALWAAAANAGLAATAPHRRASQEPTHQPQARAGAPVGVDHSISPTALPAPVQTRSHREPPKTPERAQAQPAPAAKESFPLRLHALLADPSVRDVISWLPHGRSFVVLRPDVFATRVLPLYFAPEGSNSLNAKAATVIGKDGNLQVKDLAARGVHKYPSFTRKLNRWGFRQISRGSDAGAFCHELFRGDQPELCRGMVCQKSRKSKKGPSDDLVSVSSASTMGTKSVVSCEKRPYSSTVTVSTAGGTASERSLPFKKRKSGQHVTVGYNRDDIPFMISHRNQKAPSAAGGNSNSSGLESDLTSDGGSVCSGSNAAPNANASAAASAPNAAAQAAVKKAAVAAEAAAREALARHFHEQHRAFAIASLMENSRLALQAAGMPGASAAPRVPQPVHPQVVLHVPPAVRREAIEPRALPARRPSPPILGAVTTHLQAVFAPTVSVPGDSVPRADAASTTAEVAKSALYQAYLQALSSNGSNNS
ncbi:hypothetical protein ACHAWF_003579 [Thalassiosira exigua]